MPAMAPRAVVLLVEVGPLVGDGGPGPLPEKEGGSRQGQVGGGSDGRGRAGECRSPADGRITTRCS